MAVAAHSRACCTMSSPEGVSTPWRVRFVPGGLALSFVPGRSVPEGDTASADSFGAEPKAGLATWAIAPSEGVDASGRARFAPFGVDFLFVRSWGVSEGNAASAEGFGGESASLGRGRSRV